MLKYSFLLTFISVTAFVNLQAQSFKMQAPPGYNFIYTEPNFPKGTEGSPYLNDWQKANILLKNGDSIPGLMVRYNVYSDQMMYQHDNKTYIIGSPDSISEIKLSDKTFIYKEFKKDNKTMKSFFEVVENGKASLLNKYEIQVIPANYNVALDAGTKNDRLALKQQLYLQKGDQIVALSKKNNLFQLLSDKNKEVSSYIDNERLSLKKQDDVIKILTYYNQLQ